MVDGQAQCGAVLFYGHIGWDRSFVCWRNFCGCGAPSYIFLCHCNSYAHHSDSTSSDAVDLYNSVTGAWSTAKLSMARYHLAAASVGNVALIAGGRITSAIYHVVDIYNHTSSRQFPATTSALSTTSAPSTSSTSIASAPSITSAPSTTCSNVWSTAALSRARGWIAATSLPNQGLAMFAGGNQGLQFLRY
jgi:hypothetical protein